jgi:hypothetical protein
VAQGKMFDEKKLEVKVAWEGPIKGTVQREFSTPDFFTEQLALVSIDIPKSDFEFCQIFMELFVLKISKYWLPAVTDSGESKIQP